MLKIITSVFIVTQEGLRNIPFWNSFVLNFLGTVTYSLSGKDPP